VVASDAVPSGQAHEVIVLGGGPAGVAAALLLAGRGHDVALVRPGPQPTGALAQSIPPSARKLLEEVGMLSHLEGAGFQPNGGNTVWWAGQEARIEAFDEGAVGFHVDRAGLEAAMLPALLDAGVHVVEATARSARESESGWTVACRTEHGQALELRAPWLLDATGRRGLVARSEGRKADRDTTTLAIVRRWRRPGGFPGVDPRHTLVESYADGWSWSVPLDAEVRCFTAMVDQRHVSLADADLDRALDAELDKAVRVGAVRAGAVPVGSAWACPASLYTASRFARPGLLLVGDAGSFIDPLSSFGVKKALSSGWLAAVAVHTALVDPPLGATAVAFFDQRERDVYRRYRARSADFFEACALAYGHEYWRARAEAARVAGGRPGGPDSPGADVHLDQEVPEGEARRALDRIRALPSLNAVPGRSVRRVERPTVVGHRIRLADHLASDDAPQGLRFVRNVDLLRVLDVAPRYAQVPDGWAAYNAGGPAATLPDYLAALATAFAAGILEHADEG
jgi:flavin-dependent dehydrogenase